MKVMCKFCALISSSYMTMRETLNSLDSALNHEDYASAVRKITSPTSESLGFSIFTGAKLALDSLEIDLKKKRVKKLNGVPFHRVTDFVTQAFKSPLASAVGMSPLSAALSSVTSFVTSLAAREKKVLPADLLIFDKTLKPYVEYYAGLDAATVQLSANLAVTEAQSRSVRVAMNNWIFERMKQMGIQSVLLVDRDSLSAIPETTNKLLNPSGPYSADSLDKRIAEIKIAYSDQAEPNYEALADDKRLRTTFLARNQIVGMAQQLESLVRAYREAFILYQTTLVSVFRHGTGEIKGADKNKIAKVINDLSKKHKKALRSFDTAVNLTQISTMLSAVRAQ